VFVLNRDGNAFNFIFRQLVGAVLQNTEAQAKFRELLGLDHAWSRVLQSFRGMRVRLTLESSAGFRIEAEPLSQQYQAILGTGVVVATAATATEAERRAKALGHTKSFRNISRIEAIDAETTRLNLQAFNNAAASIEKSAPAKDPAPTDFDGATTPSPGE
jgi:phosphotransferase system IIB component